MSSNKTTSPDENTPLNPMKKCGLLGGTIYKPSSPAEAVVQSNERIVPDDCEEVRHLVVDVSGLNYAYMEGQSLGVIPPGEDHRGKAHKLRLYSIASAQSGENERPDTAALTVKRVVYKDETSGETVRGIASNYISDAAPGDKFKVTGPVGKAFALPEDDDVNLLFFATGTGVAPFRAFLQRLFRPESKYCGRCLFFYGVRRKGDLIYKNDMNDDLSRFDDCTNLQIITALSREDPDGKKVYVQHRLLEYREQVWDMIRENNFAVYICGVKGMEKGIENSLREIAAEGGRDWDPWKARYKKEGRWNEETY